MGHNAACMQASVQLLDGKGKWHAPANGCRDFAECFTPMVVFAKHDGAASRSDPQPAHRPVTLLHGEAGQHDNEVGDGSTTSCGGHGSVSSMKPMLPQLYPRESHAQLKLLLRTVLPTWSTSLHPLLSQFLISHVPQRKTLNTLMIFMQSKKLPRTKFAPKTRVSYQFSIY